MLTIYIISCILVLTFAISLSAAIIYHDQLVKCNKWPSPWCYTDWKCTVYDGDTPKTVVVSDAMFAPGGIIDGCSPIVGPTELISGAPVPFARQNLTVFPLRSPSGVLSFINLSTEPALDYKGNHINGSDRKTPRNYQGGDIYWPACLGASL